MRTSTPSIRLKELMSERHLKQVDILEMSLPYQKKTGIKLSKSTLSQYITGKSRPDDDRLYLLSLTLGVSEGWIMGYDVNQSRLDDNKRISAVEYGIIPVYKKLEPGRQEKVLSFAQHQLTEQNNNTTSIFSKRNDKDDDEYITDYIQGLVAAGNGTFQEDNLNMRVRLLASKVPEEYDTIAKVIGDSMEPLIKNNDLLFIEVTSQVEINSIGIFQVNGKNFVKKLKRDYDGDWYLQSLNNNYEEIYLSENDDIRTIGEVVEIYSIDS